MYIYHLTGFRFPRWSLHYFLLLVGVCFSSFSWIFYSLPPVSFWPRVFTDYSFVTIDQQSTHISRQQQQQQQHLLLLRMIWEAQSIHWHDLGWCVTSNQSVSQSRTKTGRPTNTIPTQRKKTLLILSWLEQNIHSQQPRGEQILQQQQILGQYLWRNAHECDGKAMVFDRRNSRIKSLIWWCVCTNQRKACLKRNVTEFSRNAKVEITATTVSNYRLYSVCYEMQEDS